MQCPFGNTIKFFAQCSVSEHLNKRTSAEQEKEMPSLLALVVQCPEYFRCQVIHKIILPLLMQILESIQYFAIKEALRGTSHEKLRALMGTINLPEVRKMSYLFYKAMQQSPTIRTYLSK